MDRIPRSMVSCAAKRSFSPVIETIYVHIFCVYEELDTVNIILGCGLVQGVELRRENTLFPSDKLAVQIDI